MGRYRTFEIYTDRDLKARGCSCAEIDLYCYLIRHEKSHMSGVFFLPTRTMARERDTSEKNILTLLSSLQQKERLYYDQDEEVVWIPQMAPWQIKSGGKRINRYITIRRHLASCYSVIVSAFWERWGDDFAKLTNEIKRLHDVAENNGHDENNVTGNITGNVNGNVHCSLFSSLSSLSSLNRKEKPSKKTRAKKKNQIEFELKDENEIEKKIDQILTICSDVRFSYLESTIPPATKKIRGNAGEIYEFAQDQFRHNKWPNDKQKILAYIGLLYEAFMNYNGEERGADGKDFIYDSNYHFSGFHSRLTRWAEKVAQLRDRKNRPIYVIINEPVDLLKFASDGTNCGDGMARVDAFKRRNRDKAEEVEKFRRLSWDGVTYDEYKKREKAGVGEDGKDIQQE